MTDRLKRSSGTMTANDVQWVLWSGTIGLESAVLDRFPAATAGGYDYVSLSPLDVARSGEQGLSGAEIRRRADRPNGGILFDTWHFFRGSADFDALESVPGELVLAVQVDDAHEVVTGSLWDDTQRRLLPGDGSFDLPRVLRTLARIGGLRLVGPEVISPETAAMPAADAAQLTGQRKRELVADAFENEEMSRG